MRDAFDILVRDAMRLLRVPAAWIIVGGMTLIPPLYAWFNIIGFWDPYGNTSSLRVAVVNEDRTVEDPTLGTINMGERIVEELKENDDLGWHFVERDQALDEVKSGTSYAALIIPEGFSAEITTLTTAYPIQPTIDYFINEKANAITTKITETGANQVDQQVNSTFVSAASEVISQSLNKTGTEVNTQSSHAAQETIDKLTTARNNIAGIRSTIAGLNEAIDTVEQNSDNARDGLTRARLRSSNARDGLNATANTITTAQGEINGFIGTSSSSLDEASRLLTQASSQASLTANGVAGTLKQTNGNVAASLDTAQQLHDMNADIIEQLEYLNSLNPINNPPMTDLIEQLTAQSEHLQTTIDNLETLNASTADTISATAKAATALDNSTRSTLNGVDTARGTIASQSLPQLNSGLSTLSSTTATLSAQQASQERVLFSQASQLLDELDRSAESTRTALTSTDDGLVTLDTQLEEIVTDLSAVATSGALNTLIGEDTTLDPSNIAQFMLSPTVLSTQVLYPVATYGSGMAPLFINLSLWVGAFVLMVLVKLEVDDKELARMPNDAQRYLGRWLLLATMAVAQGLVTNVGVLIIGVQSVNPWLFVLTGMITSLVFLSITYCLSTTFQHVGKGLCVAMVIVQIPGASGLYPIEMMPGFFRALYPFFPFSYSINALRETIGGFYDSYWLTNMLKLLAFGVIFFIIGLVIRPRLIGMKHLFASELAESDMIIGEEMQQSVNPYPAAQLIAAYAEPEIFSKQAANRYERYSRLYPRLKRGALIAGIAIPIIFILTFSLTTGTKLIALATWVIWVLLIIGFLMTIEMVQGSVQRQLNLSLKTPSELQHLLHNYGRVRLSLRERAFDIVISDRYHFPWRDVPTQDIPVVTEQSTQSDDSTTDSQDTQDISDPPDPPNEPDAPDAQDTQDLPGQESE